jgi:hypothetical protein
MIDLPSQQELDELKAFDKPFCVTIYLPFDEPNAENNPNRIEFKNVLRQTETALSDAGAKPSAIAKTLKPAQSLLEGTEFWSTRFDSLVLFMHPKLFRYYHIPGRNIPHMLTVEKGFNLDPLLKVMQDNKQYYVLALSHKNVHLYEGDQYQLKPVRLKELPTDMKEALKIDEFSSWVESHRAAPASYGKGSEAVRGQYDVSQIDKELLLQFFRRIDKRLRGFLQQRRAPLVLAGVEYLLPIYRRANTYPSLLPQSITGNQEHADLDNVREKAWRLVSKQ